jgi:hypothetical protein
LRYSLARRRTARTDLGPGPDLALALRNTTDKAVERSTRTADTQIQSANCTTAAVAGTHTCSTGRGRSLRRDWHPRWSHLSAPTAGLQGRVTIGRQHGRAQPLHRYAVYHVPRSSETRGHSGAQRAHIRRHHWGTLGMGR